MKPAEIAISCILIFGGSLPLAFPLERDLCGDDPRIQRVLSAGMETSDHFRIRVNILSIQQRGAVSRIAISSDMQVYSSTDRGNTWHLAKDLFRCHQSSTASAAGGCFVSNVDPQTVYRPAVKSQHRADIEVSRDEGRSWSLVHPRTIKGRHLGSLSIIGTGMQNPGRIYAEATAVGEHGTYISDNYGKTFRPLYDDYRYLVECRANPDILYLISDGLLASVDASKSRRLLESSREIFSPLFADIFSPLFADKFQQLRSWRRNSEDKGYPVELEQIETDPEDPAIIYVLSSKGLYRSSDAGQTFRLLPLANDKVNGIQSIGVDPIDGRYLFAVANGKDLYCSSDHGCSWRKLKLPD